MANEEEPKKKQNIIEWCQAHPKTTFTIRVVLWSLLAGVIPFVFIAWRYGIFTKEPKIQITGYGFFAIIIALVFIITLVRYLYKGLQPGLLKQCVGGFASIILPLTIVYALICCIEGNTTIFKQALGCVILCEACAIPVNPFPTWLEEKRKKDGTAYIESMSDVLWDKFFKRKEQEEKK